MRKLSRFLHIIDVISEWSGKITSFLIVLIIVNILIFVLARYVWKTNSAWTYATATRIFFIYIIFGAAYVYHARAHVNVDILYGRLSLRERSFVDVVTFIAVLLFCIALLIMAVNTAVRDAPRFHFSLRSFLPPNWPVTLMAPLGVFLFLLQGLAKFVRDLITAITGKELV